LVSKCCGEQLRCASCRTTDDQLDDDDDYPDAQSAGIVLSDGVTVGGRARSLSAACGAAGRSPRPGRYAAATASTGGHRRHTAGHCRRLVPPSPQPPRSNLRLSPALQASIIHDMPWYYYCYYYHYSEPPLQLRTTTTDSSIQLHRITQLQQTNHNYNTRPLDALWYYYRPILQLQAIYNNHHYDYTRSTLDCTATTNYNYYYIYPSRRTVVGKDRSVTPECPRDTARLQRSAGGVLLSPRGWSSHLLLGRSGRRLQLRSGGQTRLQSTTTPDQLHNCTTTTDKLQ